MKTIEQLTQEYKNWCESNNYPTLSADELLVEERDGKLVVQRLEDRQWLEDFQQQWELAG